MRSDESSRAQTSRDQFIDLLRGVAIFLVLLFHSLGASFGKDQLAWGGIFRRFDGQGVFALFAPFTIGWAGVALFFAVSGFCIHSSFSKERELGTFRYLAKRTFRIYPPYLLSVLIFVLFYPGHQLDASTYGDVLAHLALLHNFFSEYIYGINASYWSISIEFQLYLLYLPMVYYMSRFGWRLTMGFVLVIELSFRTWESYCLVRYGAIPSALEGLPLTYVFSWAIGAVVAEQCRSSHAAKPIAALVPILLFCAAVIADFIKPLYPFSFAFFSASAATAILWVHGHPIELPRLAKYFCRLGAVSYSFYLFHQPIINLVPRVFRRLGFGEHPVMVFATCVAMAVPVFFLSTVLRNWIELPSVSAGYRFLRIWGRPEKIIAVSIEPETGKS